MNSFFKLLLIVGLTFSAIGIFSPVQSVFAQSTVSTNNISVETIESETLSDKILSILSESLPWYIARGSGLIAAISLIILMLSGIGQITGSTFKLLDPIVAWASHRALGIVFGVTVFMHVFSLLFDKFIKFTIPQILVPWLSDFKPTKILGINFGSLYLAFGIIAFYLSIIIVITSLTIISKKPYFWKLIHLLSYLLIVLVFFHALFLGTDLASGWMRVLWIIGGIIILISSLIRLKRAFTA